ncbi:MAG: DUF2059 domain-containing protein [Erythrobacter sp.]|jgi:hypothetical protein|nr:DUF2059 domain-containing protein [Erythrobacter sp.]
MTKLRTPLALPAIALAAVLASGPQALAAMSREPAPVSTSTPAVTPAELALAQEIVALGYPEGEREALFFATMDQTVDQMRKAIAPSLPADDPGAIAVLDEWIAEYTARSKEVLRKHIPDIMGGMAQAYATIFSHDELEDILAFVRTKSGQRYFELSPAISADRAFSTANQRYLDESMAMLGPAQADLKDRLRDYMAQKEAREAPPET